MLRRFVFFIAALGLAAAPAAAQITRVSVATNLVAGDTNGKFDVFVRDLTGATTTRVSVASDGTERADLVLITRRSR